MKSPSVSENVKIEPATTAGSASGRMTRRNVHKAAAPRSAEASRSEGGMRSSPATMGRIMYGSQRYVKTSRADIDEAAGLAVARALETERRQQPVEETLLLEDGAPAKTLTR